MKNTDSIVITKSRQLTYPAAAERIMGMTVGDRLDVKITPNAITFSKPRYSLKNVFGSVPPLPNEAELDLDERIRLTQEAHFEEKAREFRDA